jgi:hypothetical protein
MHHPLRQFDGRQDRDSMVAVANELRAAHSASFIVEQLCEVEPTDPPPPSADGRRRRRNVPTRPQLPVR